MALNNVKYIALNTDTGARCNLGGGSARAIALDALFRGDEYQLRIFLHKNTSAIYSFESGDEFLLRAKSSINGDEVLVQTEDAGFVDSLFPSSEYIYKVYLNTVVGTWTKDLTVKTVAGTVIGRVLYYNTSTGELFFDCSAIGAPTLPSSTDIKLIVENGDDSGATATTAGDITALSAGYANGILACEIDLSTTGLFEAIEGAEEIDINFELLEKNGGEWKVLGNWNQKIKNRNHAPDPLNLTRISPDWYRHIYDPETNDHDNSYLSKILATAQEIISSLTIGGDLVVSGTVNGRDIEADGIVLDNIADNGKGWFADLTALQTAHPSGSNGNWAILGSDDHVWIWDSDTNDWVDSGSTATGDMLASIYDPTGVSDDAFDMENMVEGSTKKILTPSERTAIATNTSNIALKLNIANPTMTGTLSGGTTCDFSNTYRVGTGSNQIQIDYVTGITGAFGANLTTKVRNGFNLQGSGYWSLLQNLLRSEVIAYVSGANYQCRFLGEIYANGTKYEWLRVDSLSGGGAKTQLTGNVGIGITPTEKLHVDGNQILTGGLDLLGSYLNLGGITNNGLINAKYGIRINLDSDNNSGSDSFVIGHDQATHDTTTNLLFVVQESGKVGVGITPIYTAHISNPEDIAGVKTYGAQSEGLGIHYSRDTTDDYKGYIDFIANRASSGSAGGAGFRWFYQPRSSGFPTLGISLDMAGNVGVGVDPTKKFEIGGASNIRFATEISGTVYVQTNTENLVLGTRTLDSIFIKADGNVGINQLNPTEKLHVNGNVITEGSGASTGNIILKSLNTTGSGVIRWKDSSDNLEAGIASYFNHAEEGNLEFLNGGTTNMRLTPSGNLFMNSGGISPASYTTGTLPSASANTGVILHDSTLNALVRSNGTTWDTM